MQFMVIETFRNHDARSIYRRLREKGRMMPENLKFVSSWVSADLGRCFQLMEADDITLFHRWIAEWSDLMAFEIVPVVSGEDTAAALKGKLYEWSSPARCALSQRIACTDTLRSQNDSGRGQ